MLEALISLQSAAREVGADVVIDIVSGREDEPYQSAVDYECAPGMVSAGVQLRGSAAKLAGKRALRQSRSGLPGH
jgi:hypothetical protein